MGGELDVVTSDAAEEVVELLRMLGIEVIDYRQSVPFHTVAFQQFDSFHDLVPGGTSLPVSPIGIVQLLRPVN